MIKVKYIGDDYMTFFNGKYYDIETKTKLVTGHGMKLPTPCLCVYDLHSKSWCPYSRLETFLQNWEIVEYNRRK